MDKYTPKRFVNTIIKSSFALEITCFLSTCVFKIDVPAVLKKGFEDLKMIKRQN